jgi:hypothetical protein
MVRKSEQDESAPEGDPKEGYVFLKRMLQMKPHKELIKKRHAGDAKRKQAA